MLHYYAIVHLCFFVCYIEPLSSHGQKKKKYSDFDSDTCRTFSRICVLKGSDGPGPYHSHPYLVPYLSIITFHNLPPPPPPPPPPTPPPSILSHHRPSPALPKHVYVSRITAGGDDRRLLFVPMTTRPRAKHVRITGTVTSSRVINRPTRLRTRVMPLTSTDRQYDSCKSWFHT